MSGTDSYRDSITSYYIENLPESLQKTFVPHERIPLSPGMMRAFSFKLGIPGVERDRETGPEHIALASRIQAGLDAVECKAFIRLGSRSPKDALWKQLPCAKARDALDMLSFSKRIFDDVHWACLYDYPVSLFIRPWLNIREWQEFRCIIKNGNLYGISQYRVEERPFYQEIQSAHREIANAICDFVTLHVLPHAEHADYVCDVLYEKDAVRIVDYNPLVSSTGLSFFDPRFPVPRSPEFRFWLGNGLGVMTL
jgi:hypothetical protein